MTTCMATYSKTNVVLVRYPYSDLTSSKVRPAVVIGAPSTSQDVFIVPLTSRTSPLLSGEFLLADWKNAGLNVASAVKRGVYTVHEQLVAKKLGKLSLTDVANLEASLRSWLDLP